MPAKAKPRAKKETTRPEQSLTPYLYYADVDAALSFLSKAFGFKQTGMKMKGPDGRTNHSAMKLTGGEIFMLGYPGPKYKNPKQLGNVTQGLYITVDDVGKHFLRASKAGAKIIDEPADQFYGDRRYSAADPEGHHWYFAQPIRKVSAKQMKRGADKE